MNRVVLPNDLLLGEVRDLLAEGRPVIIMTKGNSMNPFIRGEVDSVRLLKKDGYKLNEAVLAEIVPGHYVLHRIAALDGDKVTLQGDGNLASQEHCTLGDIAGAVTDIQRPGEKMVGPYDRLSAVWRGMPRIVRRYFLAIYRRIVL